VSDQEGQRLTQIVRRGRGESIRVRRAMMIMASASGTPVPAIARLVAADEDTVRDVIHAFKEKGLACLDPKWAGGGPRLISDDDIAFIVETATTPPARLGRPFTHWSIRKLADYLATGTAPQRADRAGTAPADPARARDHLPAHPDLEGIPGPGQGKPSWIGSSTSPSHFPERCFAFDQFGPLSIRPCHGSAWAPRSRPDRLPATYRRTHGIRYFHGCYSLGDDQLWGVIRSRKGGDHSLTALKSIRAARPDGAPIYVIMDNLSANKTPHHPRLGKEEQGRVVPDPDLRVLGQPDRGPVRALADLCDGRLEPSQRRRARPQAARLPAVA
jgi:transposase